MMTAGGQSTKKVEHAAERCPADYECSTLTAIGQHYEHQERFWLTLTVSAADSVAP